MPFPPAGLLDIFTRVDELLIKLIQSINRLEQSVQGLGGLPTGITEVIRPIPVTLEAPLRYEIPIAKPNRYSGTDQTYQELTSWNIDSDKASGTLDFVELWADSYDKVRWRLEAAGKVLFNDVQIDTDLTIEFGHPKLAPGSTVKLSVKSSDGILITVNGDIVGREQLK